MSQSLLKAIELLDYFDEKSELTLLDLVELSEMPKTTVFRLVSALETAGLLVKIKYSTHDVKYKLGLKLLELGQRVRDQMVYRDIALPHMRELNLKLNESVHLAVVEGDRAVYVEKFDSNKRIRLVIKIGDRAPLYAGSASKVLLANQDKQKRESFLENVNLKKITKNTIDNKELLRKELEKIREKGYGVSKEELYEGTIGFSCPVKDNSGETIAALGVSLPVTEYSEEKGKQIIEETMQTAKEISYELGYKGN